MQRSEERVDQSTWPQAEKNDEGLFVCTRGPHNIVRTSCEFALEELRGCDVYLGTPTEIASTLYNQARHDLDASSLLFLDDESGLPVISRLGFATDASDFIQIASSLGIDISERTAHRILAGSIAPLRSVSARLLRERATPAERSLRQIDLERDRRGLKISKDDLDSFSRAVERDFNDLASRYYINLLGDPKIRVHKDKITVTFDLGKDE